MTWQKHSVKCTVQISTQNTAQSFGQFDQMVECSFKNKVVAGSSQVAVTSPSHFAPASSKEFLYIKANIECGFTLKCVRGMTRIYSQMHRTGKYSEHSSSIWPVWPNGWVFVQELSGSGFESRSSHFTFRFRACFEQGVPWHSGKYRVCIQYETRTWYAKTYSQRQCANKYSEESSIIWPVWPNGWVFV